MDAVSHPPIDAREGIELTVRQVREREKTLRIASGGPPRSDKSRIHVGDQDTSAACRYKSLLPSAKEMACPLFCIRRCGYQMDGITSTGHHAATHLPDQGTPRQLVLAWGHEGCDRIGVVTCGELDLLDGDAPRQRRGNCCGNGKRNSLHVLAFFPSNCGIAAVFNILPGRFVPCNCQRNAATFWHGHAWDSATLCAQLPCPRLLQSHGKFHGRHARQPAPCRQ